MSDEHKRFLVDSRLKTFIYVEVLGKDGRVSVLLHWNTAVFDTHDDNLPSITIP